MIFSPFKALQICHIFKNSTILLQELLYYINLQWQLWPTLWLILATKWLNF